MRTQETAGRRTQRAQAAPVERIRFPDAGELRRAMTTARTAMSINLDDPRHGSSCRLYANAGSRLVQLLATDGEVAVRVRILTGPTRRTEPLDVALASEAVRAMAKRGTRTEALEIEETATAVIGADGGRQEFAMPCALQAETLLRVFEPRDGRPVAPRIERARAARALTGMPEAHGGICRIAIGPDGLRAWASSCRLIGPDYAADAVLADETDRASEEIVLGLYRNRLAGILRSMSSKEVAMLVDSHDRPVLLFGDGGRETAAVATKRLGQAPTRPGRRTPS